MSDGEPKVNVDGVPYRTIWCDEQGTVHAIDQRLLPFRFKVMRIDSLVAMAEAISTMAVRGAGLIGAATGYGMHLAAREAADRPSGQGTDLVAAAALLKATRPTAVNLAWAVRRQLQVLADIEDPQLRAAAARAEADAIADEDADSCRRIGEHGLGLLRQLHETTGRTVNVLTHCNAGWLAFVDHGTATAPIYAAHDAGIPVHVWVDETRPRNQGARLTAWELAQHGVPHTVVADNAGGHLMQRGQVDVVLVGSDRTTADGDVANKIGTYLKALAAQDTGVPFYAALPSSTIDWTMTDGVRSTPIEERDGREVTHMEGVGPDGSLIEVRLTPVSSPAANPGFDVTPGRLVTGLITEAGICAASAAGLAAQHPDLAGGS
jgi:methylthioribose-1-phosphate isomerase